MGKFVGAIFAVAVLAGSVALLYATDAPLATVLGVGAGIACLLWLLLLLTLPWNLYFRARSVLTEIAVSRDKGLEIARARDDEAARIARMMLRVAVAGHAVTALLVLTATLVLGGRAGYWVAAFFLLSTAFRPAGAYFAQLRERLGSLLKDVTFPRDDVVELRDRVDGLTAGAKALEERVEEQYRALAELRRTADTSALSAHRRADEADRRIEALAREFESTVNRLTSNEEIITGLKAFLRLLRADNGVA
ncbi:hypothetical protein [Streptomyces sp. NBC_00102]|uniref:hypothetical protein n=1 Tax=Streptomyces sp. NBC_00102 TaxID=2975652 RepID=UPI00224CF2DD|nr:hypothetical protein [Streptomyces sp. NBC_00102]MCX5401516.1 hypothetical protein [Streptomyces sp. NBC_00102]